VADGARPNSVGPSPGRGGVILIALGEALLPVLAAMLAVSTFVLAPMPPLLSVSLSAFRLPMAVVPTTPLAYVLRDYLTLPVALLLITATDHAIIYLRGRSRASGRHLATLGVLGLLLVAQLAVVSAVRRDDPNRFLFAVREASFILAVGLIGGTCAWVTRRPIRLLGVVLLVVVAQIVIAGLLVGEGRFDAAAIESQWSLAGALSLLILGPALVRFGTVLLLLRPEPVGRVGKELWAVPEADAS